MLKELEGFAGNLKELMKQAKGFKQDTTGMKAAEELEGRGRRRKITRVWDGKQGRGGGVVMKHSKGFKQETTGMQRADERGRVGAKTRASHRAQYRTIQAGIRSKLLHIRLRSAYV